MQKKYSPKNISVYTTYAVTNIVVSELRSNIREIKQKIEVRPSPEQSWLIQVVPQP